MGRYEEAVEKLLESRRLSLEEGDGVDLEDIELAHCYAVLGDKEKAEETKCLWLPKLQALDKMKRSFRSLKASQYDSVYRTKSMALRDIRILEYYINK